MSKKLPHLLPKGRLWNIKLRYFAVPALIVLIATTVTEATLQTIPDISWTSPEFIIFRFAAALAMNALVFCLPIYLLRRKGTFDELSDEDFVLTMRSTRPCLIVTIVMVVADCLRTAILHPQSTGASTSSWLFGCFLVLLIAAVKIKSAGKTPLRIFAIILTGVLALLALLTYLIGWLADLSVL